MFDILSIKLNNFKSYRGEHKFKFPKESGLYYLTGTNKSNSRLGANGVGKTSFIDSINWVLFGKSTRGLKAVNVVSWNEKGCSVSIRMKLDDRKLTIKRTQNPNSLTLIENKNEETINQETLENLLRLNPEAFKNSVILPQFGDSFFDLQPAQKLSLFSQIMDLDHWLLKSQEADDLNSKVENDLISLENKISNIKGKIELTVEGIKSLKIKAKTFDKSQDKIVKEIKGKKPAIEKEIDTLTKSLKNFKPQLSTIKNDLEDLKELKSKTSDKYSLKLKQHQKLSVEFQSVKNEALKILKEKEALLVLGPVCKVCKQKIDKNHLDKHTKGFDSELKRLTTFTNSKKDEISELERITKKINSTMIETDIEYRKKIHDCENLERQKINLEYKIDSLEKDLNNIKDLIKQELKKKNPYEVLLHEKRIDLKVKKQKIEELKSELDEKTEFNKAAKFWVSGFKRIRLALVEEAIKSLELEVNNSLDSLGLIDWKIILDVERENKSGGITKGFTVFIISPEYDKPVPFEAWSGGETQRLRMAGDLGLSNLIMERAGFVNQIEFVDEPSEHLSPEGWVDLVETLHERTLTENKKIYLCDHNIFNFGEFAGVLTVTKDKSGSHLSFEKMGD